MLSAPAPASPAPVRAGPTRAPGSGLLPLLAAALGGCAYFLGYLVGGLWPLLLVFLIPLWWALDSPAAQRPHGLPLLIGLVFGAIAHAGGFSWLWHLVEAFLAGNRWLGAGWMLLHGLWFASGFAAYAWLFAQLRRLGHGVGLAGVPALVALEWLQPQLFPVHAGAGLVQAPLLAQCAELGGPLLLTALLTLWNAALYQALGLGGRRHPGARALPLAGLAALLGAVLFGAVRVAQLARPPAGVAPLRVGIVQANLDPRAKARAAIAGHRLHVAESEALVAEGDVDLVVWPETAYVQGVRRPLPVDASLIRGPVLSKLQIPLLFGTSSIDGSAGGRRTANSVLLAGPDGRVETGYDKNILVPLAEFMPLGALVPRLRELLPHAQHYRASRETPALVLGELRIATPICYEAIHADFIRRMVRDARPDLLVTVANDAWFGDSPEPWLHLSLTRLRAIEQRKPIVRATNSGISAFIDATGRVTAQTGVLERARLRGEVQPRPGLSVYARVGDWPGPLAVAGLLGLAWRRRAELQPRARGRRGGDHRHAIPSAQDV